MTPEQYKKLPKYAREHINDLKEGLWIAENRLEKLTNELKCLYGHKETNVYINTYPDKTPLPDGSEVLFTDGNVSYVVRLHRDSYLEIYCPNLQSKEMLIRPMASNHIIIRSV